MRYRHALLAAAAIGGCLTYQPANAALTLTAAGAADGFSLSTFYSGDPSNYYGLLDFASVNSGQVIGTSYARNQLELLNDVDGQTPSTVLGVASVPGQAYSVATTPSGTYYAGQGTGYYKVNTSTLAITPLTTVSGFAPAYGLWANPVTGHLVSSTFQGLFDIDPVAPAVDETPS